MIVTEPLLSHSTGRVQAFLGKVVLSSILKFFEPFYWPSARPVKQAFGFKQSYKRQDDNEHKSTFIY
ncbi:hypothetical protein DESC_780143 [Desulfosarcina cetonica]|nr:hypothetical protein DESC_780143 [Desulfosarcina cetonica]